MREGGRHGMDTSRFWGLFASTLGQIFQKVTWVSATLLLSQSSAWALWTHPGTDLGREPSSQSGRELTASGFPEANLRHALEDRDTRIDSEFRVDPSMRESVEFWLKIYTRFSSKEIVIYDAEHPQIIYEVLDFRSLAKTARNAVVYEILSERKTIQTLKEYRLAFTNLLKNKRNRRKPSAAETRILSAIARSGHKHSIRELSQNIRSQTGQRNFVMNGISAAEPYLPMMESIFESAGIPRELTRLSLVESSFNLKAVSRAGATGVWQFMHRSGLEYMVINPKLGVDERVSPLKSSVAAAKLLRRNHLSLKSWPLAITAYHHGSKNLIRVARGGLTQAEFKRVFSLCSSKSPLGFASRNYYAEFLAMLHAETYRELFFDDLDPSVLNPERRLYRFEQLARGMSGAQAASQFGISLAEFKSLNPDIRNPLGKLPAGFWVTLPGEREGVASLMKAMGRVKVAARRGPRRSRT